MRSLKTTLIAFIAMAAVLSGCGNNSDKDSSKKEKTTTKTETTAAKKEESKADTEDSEDPFADAEIVFPERFIEETYKGDFEYNGTTFKTMQDVFNAAGEDPKLGLTGNQFICYIDNDDISVRFIANVPNDITDKLYELDVFDDNYEKDQMDLVKDLAIARTDDLKEEMLSQEERDAFVGKTIKDLEAAGLEQTGYGIGGTEGEFYFDKGLCSYLVLFNEPFEVGTDYSEEGAMDNFTIKSVTYYEPSSFNAFDMSGLLGEEEEEDDGFFSDFFTDTDTSEDI